jgi:hypothetical protein
MDSLIHRGGFVRRLQSIVGVATAVIAVAACGTSTGGSPSTATELVGCAAGADAGGGYNPQVVPSDFTTTIDNPYYPIDPGTTQHLKDSAGNVVVIEVTQDTKTILGVTTRVVHDTVSTPDGKLEEDTWDWFAQDKAGSVWYFGEDTIKYSPDGGGDKTGTWTGGVDCAKPGVVMEAHPKIGDSYRQEFYAGKAEDQADVLSLGETVTVPAGTFTNCLKTRDYTRFSPGADENKYYCAGVGNLLTVDLPESLGMREELQSITGATADGGISGIDAARD